MGTTVGVVTGATRSLGYNSFVWDSGSGLRGWGSGYAGGWDQS